MYIIYIHLYILYVLFVCLTVLRLGLGAKDIVCCHCSIRAGCMTLGKLFKSSCWKYGEGCSVLGSGLDGRGVWGRLGTCIWMAELLSCAPGTISIVNRLHANIKLKVFLKKKKCGENNIQVTILLWRLDNLRQNFTTCKVLYNMRLLYFFTHHSTKALGIVGAQ